MRSSTTFLAAASLLSLAAASPLERRYYDCTAPQVWHTCWDGWQGCCSVTPCKGPAEGVKSYCPDTEQPPSGTPGNPTPPSTPPTACSPESTPSPTPTSLEPDVEWVGQTGCKEDNSNCHWAPRFFIIKTDNETYTTYNQTFQFHVRKDAGPEGGRHDSIALFTDIPDTVTKCRIAWYKPAQGIFYGTYSDGAMNMSTLDLGDRSFEEAVGGEVSYASTKELIAGESSHGVLDLGNWGRTLGGKALDNGHDAFDCAGSELAVHFALNAPGAEGSVTVDQVSKLGTNNNGFVQRAGWYLQYV
ncbi:hypothetical protein K458DRAFT_419721 [Lentithecium fluviatile CBS 122367]|uniref:Lytic polysaccharide monooxygenase n=1 Tax=Lentithecium fluviatile CBS 122367 TaxID=1168545 RepID=A0A6G1IVN7_9PLEO|nr:hypothetical protein K458DRAFT_419721 [Lentithecium fluviatile CBS 122367]